MSEGYRTPALTGDQIDQILQAMADSFGQQLRSPILHSPAEQDLDAGNSCVPRDGGIDASWSLTRRVTMPDLTDLSPAVQATLAAFLVNNETVTSI